MDDYAINIEVIKGGFGVYVRDPEIEAANKDPKKPYRNPQVEYHLETVKAVCSFLSEVLPKLEPKDGSSAFDAAFARAVKEEETEEGD